MSKSGSKALSKSVDASVKSVVKSVESVVSSVLPKNMNMKHVLLAILVGLLLCMLMGNTVEGLACTTPATIPPGYTGRPASDRVDFGGNNDPITTAVDVPGMSCDTGYSGSVKATCSGEGEEMSLQGCVADTDTLCPGTVGESSGPYTGLGSECTSYCQATNFIPTSGITLTPTPTFDASTPSESSTQLQFISDPEQGFCEGGIAPPLQKLCSEQSTKPTCESQKVSGCKWKTMREYGEDNLRPDEFYNIMMKFAGRMKYGCKDTLIGISDSASDYSKLIAESQNINLLPTLTGSPGDDNQENYSATSTNDKWAILRNPTGSLGDSGDGSVGSKVQYYDFLHLLLGSAVENSTKKVYEQIRLSNIPAAIKNVIQDPIQEAEELWNDVDPTGETLKRNGGRVIFSYDKAHGLVFRNPPTLRQTLQTPLLNYHVGVGCPDTVGADGNIVQNVDEYSCPLDSACDNIINNKEALGLVKRIQNGPTGYCLLEKCRSNKELPECSPNKLTDDFTRDVVEAVKKLSPF